MRKFRARRWAGMDGSDGSPVAIMPSFTLRSLVGAIGLLVAMITTVAIPAAYFLVAYTSAADDLAFAGTLGANQVAQFALEHPASWRQQGDRIAELIGVPSVDEVAVRQRIYDDSGALVAEHGDAVLEPTLARSLPIVAGGATIGRIEVATSFRTQWSHTGLAAGLGFLLGAAVYFAVRIFPLNVLHSTFDALEATERRLQEYLNQRFDAAVSNVTQGLCLFNSEGR
jgi:hypothetical protein